MKPELSKKPTALRFSLGGHQNYTILIASLILFVAVCVYFVNSVVLSTNPDDAYRTQAEAKAQLINFNTSLLKQAQGFSANANNTSLPAGRYDPFTP